MLFIFSLLFLLGVYFIYIFYRDLTKAENIIYTKLPVYILIGFITNFLDVFGIGSYALTTAIYKNFKLVRDRFIPGTLNVGDSIPVILEALIFTSFIRVDFLTLIAMISSAVLGAYLSSRIISKMPERYVQFGISVSLFLVGVMMSISQMGFLPKSGEAIGLHGVKLIIGIIGNFVLGSFMPLGVGLFAPNMALIYFLGMSPLAGFPIMMGSCAFIQPVAGLNFIKAKSYDRNASLGLMLGGVPGVLLAAYLLRFLSVFYLIWIVIAVIFYTSYIMAKSAFKK